MLTCPYTAEKALVVMKEMADNLSLNLLEKRLVTDQLVMSVGYDRESLDNPAIRAKYHGEVHIDHYGRQVPKHAHGSISLGRATSSTRRITDAAEELFHRIVNNDLLIRRVNLTANNVVREEIETAKKPIQLDLFTDYEELCRQQEQERTELEKERRMQETILELKKKFGKNAILRGLNFKDGATGKERNSQIGGHKA